MQSNSKYQLLFSRKKRIPIDTYLVEILLMSEYTTYLFFSLCSLQTIWRKISQVDLPSPSPCLLIGCLRCWLLNYEHARASWVIQATPIYPQQRKNLSGASYTGIYQAIKLRILFCVNLRQ